MCNNQSFYFSCFIDHNLHLKYIYYWHQQIFVEKFSASWSEAWEHGIEQENKKNYYYKFLSWQTTGVWDWSTEGPER